MLVQKCMNKDVQLVNPDTTLKEAARKMRDGDFGVLPVSNGDRLVGMVTDRDMVVRAIAEGKDPSQAKVSECMTEQVLYCYEDQTLEEVAENLGENQIRRVPVLDRQKRLVGILSLSDLLLSDSDNEEVEAALTRISEKEAPSEDVRV